MSQSSSGGGGGVPALTSPSPALRSIPTPGSPALFAGVEPLEVFVEVLSAIDESPAPVEFYSGLCEAICRQTTMRRAAVFVYDSARERVRAVGCHGTSFAQLEALRLTPAEAPIAQRAIEENRVVVVSEGIERQVPPAYARTLGLTTLVCTPLLAAGKPYGVICADRGGGRFELGDGERHLLWTLGKVAALAAAARAATRQQDRARQLGERLDLAREVHERVVQRLFGVSLALAGSEALEKTERDRCRHEIATALEDLRSALARLPDRRPVEPGTSLRAELQALSERATPPVIVHWEPALELPPRLEPLAQSVLFEAMRNVSRHATPTTVSVSLAREEGALTLAIRNDGVTGRTRGAGMGLRLATLDALEHGGFLEFGPMGQGQSWRVRLVVPFDP